MSSNNGFNESHRRRLLANAQYADELIGEIEGILSASDSKSPFPKYQPDLSLHQARLIRGQISRFRDHLSRVLSAVGIEHQGPKFGAVHSIRVTLTFVRIAIQEMAPEHLQGYGDLSDSAVAELRGLCIELEGLIDHLERNLALGSAVDLQARLERLRPSAKEADLLRLLDRIITEDELAEFRPALLRLVEKLESPRFEIAVFGRVSSGKSSLLNRLLETDVLPVGVNPITAVPTRLVYGREPQVRVTFSDRETKSLPMGQLSAYASEERNPGNELGVTRLVVSLPSRRLQDGLVLVDTPGLGALATAGAAETRAYLPQCDLGVLLLSAVNPIDEEDLGTIEALSQAGIPVMALLSKSDLVSAHDRQKALEYTKKEVFANLGLSLDVSPVSIVGQAAQMLDDWFHHRLSPILARHQELAGDSIRRKAVLLQESVTAALRLKLSKGAAAPATTALEDVERGMRTAAGEIEEARRFCLAATDEVRSLAGITQDRCLDAILKSWDAPGAEPSTQAIVSCVAGALAAEATTQLSERLNGLADHLQFALSSAADALDDASLGQEASLQECIREMPRFEAPLPGISIPRPWFRAFGGLTRWWLAEKLGGAVATGLEKGFTNYGRALEAWVRRVLATLQDQFDAKADAYRAQLARLLGTKSLTPMQRGQLEAHLADLNLKTQQSNAGS